MSRRDKILTFRQAAEREGYFLDTETGDILRNVAPNLGGVSPNPDPQDAGLDASPDRSCFVSISDDVTVSLHKISAQAAGMLGRATSGRIINRQAALQPNGTLVTEEAEIY